ncbi:unnamed protein product [Rhodiola kirilowii]
MARTMILGNKQGLLGGGFTSIFKDLAQKRKRDPTRLELFESTYKYKGTEAYSSVEARAIAVSLHLLLHVF